MKNIKKFDNFINESNKTLDTYKDQVTDALEEIGKGLTDELIVNMVINNQKIIKKCFEDELNAKNCAEEILKKDKDYLEMNEDFSSDNFGVVNVHIDGEGFIKQQCIPYIKKALNNFQGERHIFVDGKEINPYR